MLPNFPKTLEEAIQQLESGDEGDRVKALVTVNRFLKAKKREAFWAATQALDDPSENVRLSAIEGLGETHDEQAIEPLLHALGDPDEENVLQRQARFYLVQLGEKAFQAALKALTSSQGRKRAQLALFLGEFQDERVLQILLELSAEKEDFVRECTSFALRNFKDNRVVKVLLFLLKDPNEKVRAGAAASLGQIGKREAVPALIQVIQDAEEDVRYSAVRSLGKLGDATAINPLVLLLEQEKSNLVKKGVIVSLAELGGLERIPLQKIGLFDSNDDVAEEALVNLKLLKENSIEVLIKELGSKSPIVRKRAIQGLYYVGARQTVELIMLILANANEDENVQQWAAIVLGLFENEIALDVLKKATKYESSKVQRAATEALERLQKKGFH